MSAPTNDGLLAVALSCIARGWYVFPLKPRTKVPATTDGFKSATLDRKQIERWWGASKIDGEYPEYNVGIACGPSDLCVVDCDAGIDDGSGEGYGNIDDLTDALGIGYTYAVRTGRRPGYGVQIYLQGATRTTKLEVRGQSATYTGDIKSQGGYVLAAGSIHPSGAAYEVLWPDHYTGNLFATPDAVRNMVSSIADTPVPMADKIVKDRVPTLLRVAGKLKGAGLTGAGLAAALHAKNEADCEPPLDPDEVDKIIGKAAKWADPVDDVAVTVGAGEHDPNAWRQCFHSRAETEDSPDPQFLIQGFLQEQSITGLIGPARARKSIVTINMIHALLTGEPLFGKLVVANKPERCVYLCPESGLLSLGRRIRNMGLAKYVGESLFYTSMNSEMMELDDPRVREASRGAVLFIDTLVRFFGGAEENSAGDMAKFFAKCQALLRSGVRAIVILHHTAKNAEGVRLESGRGSGDFGGSLTAAWGTTLENFDDAYNSLSLLVPVKERDFRAESFKLSPSGDDENFFLQFVDGSENARVQAGAKKKAGNAKAAAFARANPDMKAPQLRDALAAQGISYSERTCRDLLRDARSAAGIAGVTTSENGGTP